jgi:hypothetical protein
MLANMAVLKDYGINDLSATDAPPPEEILSIPVKLLIGHSPAAPVAFHIANLLQQTYLLNSKFCTRLKKFNDII